MTSEGPMPEKQANKPLTEIAFSSLHLLPSVQEGLARIGFTHCTPIQALTLPPALHGRDVAGQAQTGTGKTAAFLLVIFQRLLSGPSADSGRHPRALVLAPAEQLAPLAMLALLCVIASLLLWRRRRAVQG